MRIGWSCKEAALVLGIHARRVSQSLDPTLERIAKLWHADATKTMEAILDMVNKQARESATEPMTEREWENRRRMQTGRLNKEVHQQPPPEKQPVVETRNELKPVR